MSEIPDDILAIANRAAIEVGGCYSTGFESDVPEIIARAIMAERQRCQRLVRCGCDRYCELDEAADKIRSGEQPV